MIVLSCECVEVVVRLKKHKIKKPNNPNTQNMATRAKYGYKKDGTRRKKPGPKKGSKKRRSTGTKKRKTKGKRKPRVGSCLYGRKASGGCRKKAYKSRGGKYRGWAHYESTGLGKAIYDAPAGPARQ